MLLELFLEDIGVLAAEESCLVELAGVLCDRDDAVQLAQGCRIAFMCAVAAIVICGEVWADPRYGAEQ